MNEYEQDVADVEETDPVETESQAEACEPESGSNVGRWLKRIAIAFGVVIVSLVVLGVLLYNFGGMWLPDPELKAQYEQMVASGQAEPIQKRFTIPIPGCKCHSDDPTLTMVHTTRHIKECSSCHGGGGPMGQ